MIHMTKTRASSHIERLLHTLQTSDVSNVDTSDPRHPFVQTSRIVRRTPESSSPGSEDESDDATTLSTSDNAGGLLQAEITKMSQQLGDSRVRVATLEAQIGLLQEEKENSEINNKLCIQRLEEQLHHLGQQAERDLAELKRRQKLIDYEMPALEEQLKSVKDVLDNLDISEAVYSEIVSLPKETRTVRDHILVLAYEKMQKYREQEHTLRAERDTSRETLDRANDEVEKLKREMTRVATTFSSQKRDMEDEVAAVAAHNERLEIDLKDAIVQIQVLSAKGALYDEVKEKLDKLTASAEQTENQKTRMETTMKACLEEKQRLLDGTRDKDHIIELLRMDKVYLNKEVQMQEELVKKLQGEKEKQQEKLRELKRMTKDRTRAGSEDSHTAQEIHLQAEIQRLRENANQDLERIRKEAKENAEREIWVLREMRDAALSEVERLRAALEEIKSGHEELVLKYRELQRTADKQEIEYQGKLKIKQFELERLGVVHEETRSTLNQARLENEALMKKVKVLTEKYHELELEMDKKVLKLTETRQDTTSHPEGRLNEHEDGHLFQKVALAIPGVVRKKLQQHSELERFIKELVHEKTLLAEKLRQREAEVCQAKELLLDVHQPQEYFIDKIQRLEGKLNETVANKDVLEIELRAALEEKDKAILSLHKLREDMKRLLEARGSVETLQKLLLERVGKARDDFRL